MVRSNARSRRGHRRKRRRARSSRRRPTSTRSIPARSRDRLDLREPGLAHQPRDRRGLPGADLERDRARRTSRRPPAAAGGSRRARRARRAAPAPARSARSRARARRRPRRRAGWRRPRRAARRRRRAGRRGGTRPRGRAAPRSRARRRARRRSRRSPTTRRSGRSAFSASAIAPEPVPTSQTRAPRRQVEQRLDEVLGLRAAGSARAGRPPARSSGSPSCRGCRRPARARAGARRTPWKRARGVRLEPRPGRTTSAARSTPIAAASSSSASSRGVSQPAAVSAITAESSASRTLVRPISRSGERGTQVARATGADSGRSRRGRRDPAPPSDQVQEAPTATIGRATGRPADRGATPSPCQSSPAECEARWRRPLRSRQVMSASPSIRRPDDRRS